MFQSNPRVDILLVQKFHGNEVILFRGEVRKGEIVLASVLWYQIVNAWITHSKFRDVGICIQ